MKRYVTLFIFLFVITIILASLHVYILGRLLLWSGVALTPVLVGAMVLLILSFPIASLAAVKWTNRFTAVFYDIAAIWLGALVIMLSFVVIGELVRVAFSPLVAARFVLGLGFCTIVFALVNANSIRVRRHTIRGDVKKEYVIAVASDIHAGAVHGRKYVQRIVDMLRREQPDMLLLPGDLVDGPGLLPDDVLQPLNELDIPIYYSFGNHEHYVGAEHVQRVIKGTRVRLLRDEAVKDGEFTIIGVDDREDRDAVKKHLPKFTKNKFNILLYHRPEGLAEAAKKGVDLMVSGHTHFGQIFPFTLLVRMRFAMIKGWYAHGKAKLFVSTGAGTWGPPMRLGSGSEVVLITVRPAE